MYKKIPILLLAAVIHIAISPLLQASASGSRVHYVGGTDAALTRKVNGVLDLGDNDALVFECQGSTVRVPYGNINTVEYGQNVKRRYVEALLISPLLLMSKKRSHFLTLGFVDAEGHQQAMIFKVGSGDIRSLLVSIEARTGRRVEFQDDEARKDRKSVV